MIKFATVSVSATVAVSVWLVLSVCMILPAPALAQSGDLDPTFGNGGIVTTDFFNNFEEGRAIAIAPDGKIVVAGTLRFDRPPTSDLVVARYFSDGSLDTSFGLLGRVRTDLLKGIDVAGAVAVQPDGKIVVAGTAIINHVTGISLVRYNLDGTLDKSFGIRGATTTPLSGAISVNVLSILLQRDGKIVVGGDTFINGDNPSFLLGRYGPDGSLDTTFGKSGLVLTDIANMNVPPGSFGNARMGGLALQDDGKIVAAGVATLPISPDGSNFALARYETNGALDTSFGNGGIVNIDFGDRNEMAHAVTLQRDGKIVAAGEGTLFGIFPITMVVRYNADGTPDTTFGIGGAARPLPALETNTRANAVAIQADGRIVTAGEGFFFGQSVVHQFAAERFDTTGAFDRTFGKGGLMLANTSDDADGTKSFDIANAIVIQDDGKILVAGTTEFGTAIDVSDVALARFQP